MKFGEYINEASKSTLKEYAVIKSIDVRCGPFIKEFRRSGANQLLWRGSSKALGGSKVMVQIKPREDRMPKDMPPEIHDQFNDRFKQKFGWYVRSEGVFTTAKRSDAESYGTGYIFMPVGEYEYVYNPQVPDLYSDVEGDQDAYMEWDSSSAYDDYEYEYEQEYGEDSGQGTYYWDDLDTGESDWNEAISVAVDAEGTEDIDESLMKWVPEVPYDDWIYKKAEEHNENIDDNYESIMKGYRNDNLGLAIKTKVEVVFSCNSYFLIDAYYYDPILNYLKTGKVEFDPAQMELDFEKDPKIRRLPSIQIKKFEHITKTSWQHISDMQKNILYNKLKTKVGPKWKWPTQKQI